jgi:hypothetical protein
VKRAIVHRKDALFYKTDTGAQVGDTFMSPIRARVLMEVIDHRPLVLGQPLVTGVERVNVGQHGIGPRQIAQRAALKPAHRHSLPGDNRRYATSTNSI